MEKLPCGKVLGRRDPVASSPWQERHITITLVRHIGLHQVRQVEIRRVRIDCGFAFGAFTRGLWPLPRSEQFMGWHGGEPFAPPEGRLDSAATSSGDQCRRPGNFRSTTPSQRQRAAQIPGWSAGEIGGKPSGVPWLGRAVIFRLRRAKSPRDCQDLRKEREKDSWSINRSNDRLEIETGFESTNQPINQSTARTCSISLSPEKSGPFR